MTQKALDCTTGIIREITTNEKMLLQNDQHLSSHLKIKEMLAEIQKKLDELTSRVKCLEEATIHIYWEVFDEPNTELKILDTNKKIED